MYSNHDKVKNILSIKSDCKSIIVTHSLTLGQHFTLGIS